MNHRYKSIKLMNNCGFLQIKTTKICLTAAILTALLGLSLSISAAEEADSASRQAKAGRLAKSPIKELGGKVLIDSQVEVTQGLQLDRYVDFVGVSTPTYALGANHANLWLNNAAKKLCTRFDNGTSGCLEVGGGAAGDITDVNAGLGLTGGGASGSVTIYLSTPINNSYIDSSSITKQGNFYSISDIAASTGALSASTTTLLASVNALSVSTASLRGEITALATTYLTLSSATATYLQKSSATATYLNISSAPLTYLNISSAPVTYLFQSSATVTYLTQSSATVTYCNANGTNCAGSTSRYVQSVQCTVTASSATNTATYAFTNLNCSITPGSSSNKIKITISGMVGLAASGSSGTSSFSIHRGTTRLSAANGFTAFRHVDAANSMRLPLAISYIDSPSTTSNTTYTLSFANDAGVTVTFNEIGCTSVMLLEEITN